MSMAERTRAVLEPALTHEVAATLWSGTTDPVAFLSARLALAAGSGTGYALPEEAEQQTDKWSAVSWLKGVGVHRVVAGALQAANPGADDEAMLEFVRRLPDRASLEKHICTAAVLNGIVELVWDEALKLKQVGAATANEIQSKFAGALEMSYAGLDTFFDGLEGVVGGPAPKLLGAMREEHCNRADSNQEFVTDNYGVRTTSKTEFLFVYDPDGEAPIEWPCESIEKLPDRSKARKRRPISELEQAAQPTNKDLEEAKQPTLCREEIMAANLYTGPVRAHPSRARPDSLLLTHAGSIHTRLKPHGRAC